MIEGVKVRRTAGGQSSEIVNRWVGVLLVVLAVLMLFVVVNRPHRSASGPVTDPPVPAASMSTGIGRETPPP